MNSDIHLIKNSAKILSINKSILSIKGTSVSINISKDDACFYMFEEKKLNYKKEEQKMKEAFDRCEAEWPFVTLICVNFYKKKIKRQVSNIN